MGNFEEISDLLKATELVTGSKPRMTELEFRLLKKHMHPLVKKLAKRAEENSEEAERILSTMSFFMAILLPPAPRLKLSLKILESIGKEKENYKTARMILEVEKRLAAEKQAEGKSKKQD